MIDKLGIPPTGLRVPLALATSSDIVDKGIPQQAIKLLPFFPTILVKLGPEGVLLVKLLPADAPELYDEKEREYVLARNSTGGDVGGVYIRLFRPERVLEGDEIVSVNGIGDTFAGAVAVGMSKGEKVQRVVGVAQRAAGESLKSRESVSPGLKELRGEFGRIE